MLEETLAAKACASATEAVKVAVEACVDASGSSSEWVTKFVSFIEPWQLICGALEQEDTWVLWKGVKGRVRLGLGLDTLYCHADFETANQARSQWAAASPLLFFGGRFDSLHRTQQSAWAAWGGVEVFSPLVTIEWDNLDTTQARLTLKLENVEAIKGLLVELLSTPQRHAESPKRLEWRAAESETQWCHRVLALQSRFDPKGLEKVVMARQMDSECAVEPPQRIAALEKLLLHGEGETVFVVGRSHGTFVGSSPETLVNLTEGQLETHALAGTSTADQDVDNLSADEKIRREHETVITHLKTKLERIAGAVQVDETQLRRSRSLRHLETKMRAVVGDKHLLGLVSDLHPTPALGGAPTQAAQAWLRKYEDLDRGWFGGPIGWFHQNGDGQCAVAIRCALLDARGVHAYAGAGIVKGSDPLNEWRETQAKFASIIEAFQGEDF